MIPYFGWFLIVNLILLPPRFFFSWVCGSPDVEDSWGWAVMRAPRYFFYSVFTEYAAAPGSASFFCDSGEKCSFMEAKRSRFRS